MRLILAGVLGVAVAAAAYSFWPRAVDPLLADGGDSVTVLPFASGFDPDDLPSGWQHRTFWFVPPMALSVTGQQGRPALRCGTDAGGSLLLRDTQIAVTDYPLLKWDWFVEIPITSDVDERTEEGDDHPARLFLRFADGTATEIIWGNTKLVAGDEKRIGDFYHLVVRGGAAEVGQWHAETVDLPKIYRDAGGQGSAPVLSNIGIFCDSDNTGAQSVAYFGDVTLSR